MSRGHRKFIAGLTLALLLALPAAAAPNRNATDPEPVFPPLPRAEMLTEKVMPEIPAPAPGDETSSDQSEPAPDATSPDSAPPDAATPPAASDEPVPVVEYDFSKLPEPVAKLRQRIIDAASTGDIQQLKPIIDGNGEAPQFSFDEIDEPIAFLKSLSGDPEGREILAIMVEVLDAGYVHVDVGTPDEMYIWPYFARYPVDKLTPRQLVELFKLIYAGDYEDMKQDGNYLFYRVGITPTGVWKYFVAGD